MSDPITSFRGTFLSNFWPSPLHMKKSGLVFPTVEHAYQASKTLDRRDHEYLARSGISAAEAKRAGKRLVLRPDFDALKLKFMRHFVSLKFAQHACLAARLKTTADALLVEQNYWHDNFWGVCTCGRCRDGLNHLGRILMDIRSTLP